jgi:hypothetical protein
MDNNIMIYFSKTKDYKILFATGAWGGVSPSGDIAFDLFIDKNDNPEYLKYQVDTNKAKEVERGKQKFIRESQIGVILKPDVAYTIGNWLVSKAKEAGIVEKSEKKK